MAKKSILAPIKKLAKKILRPEPKYVHDKSHTVITDYSEYSGLSIAEIENRINSFKKLTSGEWKATPGDDFKDKSETFYTNSKYYICDILSGNVSKQVVIDNMNRFTPLILESIRNHPGKDFMEFGGGTGIFCDIVHHMGKNVTYLDLPTPQMEFARWRYKKYNLPIRIVETQPGKLELDREYDIFFTDAVIEHIPDPVPPVRHLASKLRKGGLFVMLVDLAGEDHDMPMHKDVDIAALHKVLLDAGLQNTHGLNTFCSLWTKP
jgi:2-polyprenyl-3-methyl-5-hydroxy-6-metoxy-1,4-benzoquinol methylase